MSVMGRIATNITETFRIHDPDYTVEQYMEDMQTDKGIKRIYRKLFCIALLNPKDEWVQKACKDFKDLYIENKVM